MRILVAYASKHGSTEEIARAIHERFLERGFESRCANVATPLDIDGADVVVLGSAIYYGHWMEEARGFAKAHHDELTTRPLFLFSSGPVTRDLADPDHAAQPKDALELREELGAKDHVVFGGKLDLDQLGFGERMVVKFVGGKSGDARDFDVIAEWADAVANRVT
jgi:menaquinone-dependent protoporphyrinogen oxidase